MVFSHKKSSGCHGFTLLELSVVLVIISVIVGVSLAAGLGIIASARQAATIQKMTAIEKALMSYRASYDRIPCPASLTITVGSTNFGVEAANPGSCTGGTPAATSSATGYLGYGNAAEGAVPVATLGLPNDFMFDGWGNRFRYGVNTTYTAYGAFAYTGAGFNMGVLNVSELQCISGSYPCTNDATSTQVSDPVYVLLSHGPNGHGAYNYYGNVAPMDTGPDAGSLDYNEGINTHTQTGFTSANQYVRFAYNNGTAFANLSNGSPATYFDDIVDYKDRAQMALPTDNWRPTAQYLAVSTNTSPYLYAYLFVGGTQTALTGVQNVAAQIPSWTSRLWFSYDDSALLFSANNNKIYNYVVTNQGTVSAQTNLMANVSPGQYCPSGSEAIFCLLSSASISPAIAPVSFGTQYANGNRTYSADNTPFSALSPDKNSRFLAVSATSTDYLQLFTNYLNPTYNAYVTTAQGANVVNGSNTNSSTKATVEWSPNGTTLFYLSPAANSLYGYTLYGNTLVFNSNYTVNLSTYQAGLYSAATTDLSVHPSGNYIAIAGGTYVLVFALPLSNPPALVTSINTVYTVSSIVWSPDGSQLAVDDATNGINLYSFSQATNTFTNGSVSGGQCGANSTGLSKPAWTSDSAYLAVANDTSGSGLCIYARSTSGSHTTITLLSNISSPTGVIKALAFSHVAAGSATMP